MLTNYTDPRDAAALARARDALEAQRKEYATIRRRLVDGTAYDGDAARYSRLAHLGVLERGPCSLLRRRR